MTDHTRTIEIDAAAAELFEREAQARGLTLRELLSELAGETLRFLPPDLERMRASGQGPWSPEALAEDTRAVEQFERTGQGVPYEEVLAWMKSWGTARRD